MLELLSKLWCKSLHPRPMWPIHGYYTCPRCLRAYRVPWEGAMTAAETPAHELRTTLPIGMSAGTAPAIR